MTTKDNESQVSQQYDEGVLTSHEATLFRPTTTRFDPRRVLLPDSFFDPTSSELSSAIRSYADVSQRMTNATLQTRKMRKAEEDRRMSRFRKVMIRILFPDRISLQGVFTPRTTVRQVEAFVQAALREDVKIDFNLFVTPPKKILKDPAATLWTEGLVPAALVHFGSASSIPSSSTILRSSLLDAITDAPESTPPPQATEANEAETTEAEPGKATEKKSSAPRKTPKWFKSKK